MELEVPPQYSENEMSYIKAAEEAAKKVGDSITIGEFVALFLSGRAIMAMWLLI